MRLALSASLLACLCACGTLSNEDLAFIEAIPQRGSLHVQVPQGANGQTACSIDTADAFTQMKTSGQAINDGIDGILALVDTIRGVPPSVRTDDSRAWGPWNDAQHPGVQYRVEMQRDLDAKGIPWHWSYVFGARRTGDFLPVIEGEFFGAAAKNGIGRLTLHFENSAALGTNKPTDPTVPARAYYDLTSEPRTLELDLSAMSGFGLLSYDYAWAGYADGHGRFDYAFPDPKSGCTIDVSATFAPSGAGAGRLHFICNALVQGNVDECWDQSACLTYVSDPYAFSQACKGVKPCVLGSAGLCPAFP